MKSLHAELVALLDRYEDRPQSELIELLADLRHLADRTGPTRKVKPPIFLEEPGPGRVRVLKNEATRMPLKKPAPPTTPADASEEADHIDQDFKAWYAATGHADSGSFDSLRRAFKWGWRAGKQRAGGKE